MKRRLVFTPSFHRSGSGEGGGSKEVHKIPARDLKRLPFKQSLFYYGWRELKWLFLFLHATEQQPTRQNCQQRKSEKKTEQGACCLWLGKHNSLFQKIVPRIDRTTHSVFVLPLAVHSHKWSQSLTMSSKPQKSCGKNYTPAHAQQSQSL